MPSSIASGKNYVEAGCGDRKLTGDEGPLAKLDCFVHIKNSMSLLSAKPKPVKGVGQHESPRPGVAKGSFMEVLHLSIAVANKSILMVEQMIRKIAKRNSLAQRSRTCDITSHANLVLP